jgi:hypothetical protein
MSRRQALKWPNYLYYGKEGRLVDEDGAEKDEDLQRMFKVPVRSTTSTLSNIPLTLNSQT